MKFLKVLTLCTLAAFAAATFSSCSDDDKIEIVKEITPQQLLSQKTWVTTKVTNAKTGELINNDVAPAANFVGYAYYEQDGTFAIYSLKDVLRSSGRWSVSPDGKTRTLIFADNTIRTVDILQLTNDIFTYRIVLSETVTLDVEHIPADHARPAPAAN